MNIHIIYYDYPTVVAFGIKIRISARSITAKIIIMATRFGNYVSSGRFKTLMELNVRLFSTRKEIWSFPQAVCKLREPLTRILQSSRSTM